MTRRKRLPLLARVLMEEGKMKPRKDWAAKEAERWYYSDSKPKTEDDIKALAAALRRAWRRGMENAADIVQDEIANGAEDAMEAEAQIRIAARRRS